MRYIIILVVIAFLHSVSALAEEGSYDLSTLSGSRKAGEVNLTIFCDGRTAPYSIPAGVADISSFSVMLDDKPLLSTDYTLDAASGSLSLNSPPPAGSIIQVSYRLLLAKEQNTTTQESSSGGSSGIDNAESGDLNITGSKSITVRTGSGNALSLDQTLDLTINGKAADDLTIEGRLSDQNTPVEPEGTTEQLSSLDSIYMKAQGNRWNVTLGDVDIAMNRGDFLPFSRKALGIVGATDQDAVEATGFFAASRGRTATSRITATEGVQGPYLLTVSGESDITIVPGSESVWLDGVSMRRGESNDYTIDYTTAGITFTVKRPISAGMNILVEYEYTNQAYQRGIYGAEGIARTNDDSMAVGMAVVREEDDRYSDLMGLTDADRLELKKLGDGSGGFLRQKKDGDGNLLYRYVGTGYGSFTRQINPVSGEYEYHYVGTGLGDYEPYEELVPTPSRKSMADLTLRLGKPLLQLNGEYALSERDYNLFSPLDDQDNQGQAYSGRLSSDFPTSWGDWSVYVGGRREEERFSYLSAEGDEEFIKEWDMDGRNVSSKPSLGLGEAGIGYGPAPNWWIALDGGRMKTRYHEIASDETDELLETNTDRVSLTLTGPEQGTTVSASTNILLTHDHYREIHPYTTPESPAITVTEGNGLVRTSSFSTQVPVSKWVLGFAGDENLTNRTPLSTSGSSRTTPGIWRYGAGPTLSFTPIQGVTLGTSYRSEREERSSDGSFVVRAKARSIGTSLNWHAGEVADWTISYTNRLRYSKLLDELPRQESNLADSSLLLRPWQEGLRCNLHYHLEGSAQALYAEYFVVSEDRKGDYRRVQDPSGEGWLYIYDPGDPESIYDRELLSTGQHTTVNNAEAGGTVELAPRYWVSETHLLSAFSLFWELNLVSNSPDKSLAALFFTRSFSPSSVHGEEYQRYTLRIQPVDAFWQISPYYTTKHTLDRSISSQEEWQRETEIGMNSSSTINTYFSLETGGLWQPYHRWMVEKGITGSENARGTYTSANLRPIYHPASGWDLYLEGKLNHTEQTDREEKTLVRGWEVAPGFTLPLLEGRLNGEYRRITNDYYGSLATRLILSQPPGVGHRMALNFSRAFGSHFSGSVGYRGREDEGRAWVHSGEMTMAGYF